MQRKTALTPLQRRIVELLQKQPSRSMHYHAMLHELWPPEQFPKSWNYSSNGGPPGCAMTFGRAFGRLRQMKLVTETYAAAGRGDLMLLRDPD